YVYTFVTTAKVGTWDARSVGLGGWTIDVHHTLDPETGVLYRGDGSPPPAKPMDSVILRYAGSADDADLVNVSQIPADGTPALNVNFGDIHDIAVSPDGQLYVATSPEAAANQTLALIFRIDRDGKVYRVAGAGLHAQSWVNDNPATAGTSVALGWVRGLAFGPDGNLYYSDVNVNQAHGKIAKIDLVTNR